MKRLNKEYPIDISECIEVKYGSINREKPLVVYIEGKSWICPNFNGDFEEEIDCVMANFKKRLRKAIFADNLFENNFVFDFDVKTASLRENKKSFMSFEFFLRQPNEGFLCLKDLKNHIMTTYKDIIDNLAIDLSNHTFSLSKTKH